MLAADNLYPRFKDNWARALTYRYRPLQEATPVNRVDNTLKEVIQQAEEWIDILFDAMCNVVNVNNKPNSIELNMFKSPTLDKKSVEAACRSILVGLMMQLDRSPWLIVNRSLSSTAVLLDTVASGRVLVLTLRARTRS